jgi:hypothetical protein
MRPGDAIFFVFAVPEIIAVGDMVAVNGTGHFAVAFSVNSHFIMIDVDYLQSPQLSFLWVTFNSSHTIVRLLA